MLVRKRIVLFLAATTALSVAPCCLDHYRIHPEEDPPSVSARSEELVRGDLRVRLEWVQPLGAGPFPAVMIHPEAGKPASKMRGILRDLALEGYLAVAADYLRLPDDDSAGGSLFAWRGPEDATFLVELVREHPLVDADRIGAMGYSQGGVYSLLIAAHAPDVRAVVAYYPVTDFEYWLSDPDRHWGKRQAFKLIRRYFRRHSGARTDEEFSEALAQASPFRQAEHIAAPVLLIHGDRDSSAGIVESRRLEQRLQELGRDVALLEVRGAGHVFNFRNTEKAGQAWEVALAWLDRHLK